MHFEAHFFTVSLTIFFYLPSELISHLDGTYHPLTADENCFLFGKQ